MLYQQRRESGFEFEAKAPKAEKPAAKAAKADESVAASDAPAKKATKTAVDLQNTTQPKQMPKQGCQQNGNKTTMTKVVSTRAIKKPAVRKTGKNSG